MSRATPGERRRVKAVDAEMSRGEGGQTAEQNVSGIIGYCCLSISIRVGCETVDTEKEVEQLIKTRTTVIKKVADGVWDNLGCHVGAFRTCVVVWEHEPRRRVVLVVVVC